MCSDEKVVLFSPYLKAKQAKTSQKNSVSQRLGRGIAEGGWLVSEPSVESEVDVVVYLLDKDSSSAVAFGNTWSDYQDTPAGSWRDFVMAWDVLADPNMAFDQEHLQVTAELARRAIVAKGLLPSPPAVEPNNKLHLVLLVDRDNLESPAATVPAVSSAHLLDARSVREG